MSTLRALVTGASGFLGVALVPDLVRAGLDVTGVSRRSRESRPGLRWTICDMADAATLDRLVQNVDVVINGAARTGNAEEAQDPGAFYRINRDAAVALLRASEVAGVRAFIQVSSTGVVGSGEGSCDEASPCRPTNVYEQSKLQAENVLLAAWKRQQMRLAIVRPSNIFGEGHPRRKLLTWLRTVKQGRAVLAANSATHWVNYIYLGDVARAIAGLARTLLEDSVVTVPAIVNLNCPVTAREFLEASAFGLGIRPRAYVLPGRALMVLGIACDVVAGSLGRSPLMTREKARELTNRQIFAAERAKQALPGFPWIGLREGLRRTCDYYRAGGLL